MNTLGYCLQVMVDICTLLLIIILLLLLLLLVVVVVVVVVVLMMMMIMEMVIIGYYQIECRMFLNLFMKFSIAYLFSIM